MLLMYDCKVQVLICIRFSEWGTKPFDMKNELNTVDNHQHQH